MPNIPRNYISAERLVKLFLITEEKEKFKYIIELNSWIYFSEDNIWTIDNAYDDLYIALEKIIDTNDALDYWDNERIIKRAITNLQRRTYFKINLKDLDTHDNLFNCNNGVLNLDTLELIPHGSQKLKSLLITKKANVTYNADAKCPRFEKMLMDMFSGYDEKQKVIEYLQKILGLSLSGYNYEQLMYFLQGNGSNGKTTLTELIYDLLGDYAINFHKKYLIKQGSKIDRCYNFDLHGARFVLVKNFDENDKLEEATIKQLTGGDTLQFKLVGHTFDFKFKGKLYCVINDIPKCLNGSLALRRRIKTIPLLNNFKKGNLTFYQELSNEKDGILNWLVTGYRKIDKNNGIDIPKNLDKMSNVLINDSIPKTTLVIDRYLDRDEMHVLNIEQAVNFINRLASFDKCKMQKKDFVPANLGIMLKKYSVEVHSFNAREKFYLGVKLKKELFEETFGVPMEFNGIEGYTFKIFDTHIKEQIQFFRDVIDEITDEYNKQQEAELLGETLSLNFMFDHSSKLIPIKEKAERNLKLLENYYKKLQIEDLEDDKIYSYEDDIV